MYLADTFIQSDLQYIQVIHFFCQYVCSLGIEPWTMKACIMFVVKCSVRKMIFYEGFVYVLPVSSIFSLIYFYLRALHSVTLCRRKVSFPQINTMPLPSGTTTHTYPSNRQLNWDFGIGGNLTSGMTWPPTKTKKIGINVSKTGFWMVISFKYVFGRNYFMLYKAAFIWLKNTVKKKNIIYINIITV